MILSEKFLISKYGTSKQKLEVRYVTLEKLDENVFDEKKHKFKILSKYLVKQCREYLNVHSLAGIKPNESKESMLKKLTEADIDRLVKNKVSNLNLKSRQRSIVFSSTNSAEAAKIFKFLK